MMSSMATEYPPYMTPAEVAALFRVGSKTVERWAKQGRIHAIRTPGGHRRYKTDDILAYYTTASDPQPDDPQA